MMIVLHCTVLYCIVLHPQDAALELQYKVCYARILDSKRRFLEAALRFYELSLVGTRQGNVDPEELLQSLNHAITCTVLAPAGEGEDHMGAHDRPAGNAYH